MIQAFISKMYQIIKPLVFLATLFLGFPIHAEQDFQVALAQNLLNYHLSNEKSYLEQLKVSLSENQVIATQTDLEKFKADLQDSSWQSVSSFPAEVKMFLKLGQTLQESDFQLYASDVKHREVSQERLKLIKDISSSCNIHSLNIEMASRVRSITLTNLVEQIYGSVDTTIIEKEIKKHRSKITKNLEDESERALLYIYRFTPTKNLYETNRWCNQKTLTQSAIANLVASYM